MKELQLTRDQMRDVLFELTWLIFKVEPNWDEVFDKLQDLRTLSEHARQLQQR